MPIVTNNKVIEVTAEELYRANRQPRRLNPRDQNGNPPAPGSPIPVPIRRQILLEALAKATDSQFNENPRNTAKDKGYRLFSSCRFTVVFENKKILAAVPSALEVDVATKARSSRRRSSPIP